MKYEKHKNKCYVLGINDYCVIPTIWCHKIIINVDSTSVPYLIFDRIVLNSGPRHKVLTESLKNNYQCVDLKLFT